MKVRHTSETSIMITVPMVKMVRMMMMMTFDVTRPLGHGVQRERESEMMLMMMMMMVKLEMMMMMTTNAYHQHAGEYRHHHHQLATLNQGAMAMTIPSIICIIIFFIRTTTVRAFNSRFIIPITLAARVAHCGSHHDFTSTSR